MALDGIGTSGTGSASATTLPPAEEPPALARLAGDIAMLRGTDPAAADQAQRSAEQGLSPVERGQLANAIDARTAAAQPGWRGAFDKALAVPGAVGAFQAGVRDGVIEGAKSFVVGTATLVGKTIQFAADSGIGGWLGDRLRGATGGLSCAVDAIVPSNVRGTQTAESLKATATAIKDYAVSRAQDPHKLLSDTQGFIDKHWNELKAGHAAAAAKGPEAEAKWWGHVMGRAAFEVGITVVPIAGQAGKVTEGVRATEAVVEGGRIVKAGETAGTVAKAGETAATIAKPADIVEGFGFRADFKHHLIGPDGFTKSGQLSGTHNAQNAIAAITAKGGTVSLTPTATPGIAELSYKYVNASGKTISGTKTVYDAAVISDAKMVDLCQKAGRQAFELYRANPAQTKFDLVQDGVHVRAYINFDKATGAAYVGNVHPIK